jgi:hypothetical protein
MAKVKVLVPYRSDGGRRDELWGFVESWLGNAHPGWPVVMGHSPLGPFNRGAAINVASEHAGDWEIAIIHDADTLTSPWQLRRAVQHIDRGHFSVVYPFETYTYLDKWSTQTLLDGHGYVSTKEHWFLSPEDDGQNFRTTVRHHHVSGAVVVSRAAWEAVGGFIELEGWGAEDQIMHHLFKTFADKEPFWSYGGAYHLWHPANRGGAVTNHRILSDVMALTAVPDQLRQYLRDGGHPIPEGG